VPNSLTSTPPAWTSPPDPTCEQPLRLYQGFPGRRLLSDTEKTPVRIALFDQPLRVTMTVQTGMSANIPDFCDPVKPLFPGLAGPSLPPAPVGGCSAVPQRRGRRARWACAVLPPETPSRAAGKQERCLVPGDSWSGWRKRPGYDEVLGCLRAWDWRSEWRLDGRPGSSGGVLDVHMGALPDVPSRVCGSWKACAMPWVARPERAVATAAVFRYHEPSLRGPGRLRRSFARR